MKRSIAALSLVAVLALSGSASAIPNDEYDDSQSYPLRVAAYLIHTPHGAEEMRELAQPSY
jgi:hypothetical protein